ncbi:FAD-binding and (Fe-S)-binding domain-containing protein [Pseudactinotalea sp. HY158]|uniref:FAD-binding and (Fe-S)-binding domain-containing protein n=1 Tax=Pseudactinotalea sp. HY158 TaxID=2654547 RepID=UPI00129D1EB0|nr:FAD-binding and (Fe-S)-binding domain-containing protein [Pseudactinotalea sp. HY158]QGH68397.1 FAD-binding protein [Pseudactinotalea sp. HY158]
MANDLISDLREHVAGAVDVSKRRRAEYSTDASNYRIVPEVVVFPETTADVRSILDIARSHSAPITARGGGTSIAGNAVGPGVVLDFSRHLNRVLEIDPQQRLARVEPGVVMSDLQAALAPHGLRFGPDPSTQNRATLAGMIGNNACGPHAVAYGRTSDNVASLEVIDGRGRAYTAADGLAEVPGLERIGRANLATIRTEFGRFSRQVSGYSLEHLLPENRPSLARFLVGTEGTLVTVTEATMTLVEIPSSPIVVALGYPSMAEAADAVPAMLGHSPLAVEGLDAALVDVVRQHRGDSAIPDLPRGAGWLLVEVGGATPAEAEANARALAADAGTDAVRIIPAGPEAAALWRIRADGAGLAGRTATGGQAWPGWEDAAVPPERLGAYLREHDELMASYGVTGLPYGHFGDGCIHIRIDFPLDAPGGRQVFRDFLLDAGRLVAKHGGSASGEHGDGRARSELLPLQYSADAIAAFGEVKNLFDPDNLLNPGVLVDPDPLDHQLRRPQAVTITAAGGFGFAHDQGSFTNAVHRCVGVGKCRADNSAAGGFMCPSYQATRDEKDSTRGRARVLQELTNGTLVGGWDNPAVHESLDLCLSCKACSTDCPAGVDMAQYKSEVLHRTYRGKRRPIAHYALGWLPRWGRLLTAVPGVSALANAALKFRPLARLVLRAGGMDPRRGMVEFNTTRFSRWVRSHAPRAVPAAAPGRPQVMLWADSFSEYLADDGARATLAVLEAAGFEVLLPPSQVCCGLTWISTGQLDGAKARLSQTMEVLAPYAEAGIPIVGVEPSCTAVLRSDLLDLFPDDARAHTLAGRTRTLAEVLREADFPLPDLSGHTIVVQPHCHQYSVSGFEADRALLAAAGAQVTELAGCCGMAGNFGMEAGHYEVSVAVAENALLPALREAPEGAIYLADGFSCRTQAEDLAGVRGMTLAQLLSGARPPEPPAN